MPQLGIAGDEQEEGDSCWRQQKSDFLKGGLTLTGKGLKATHDILEQVCLFSGFWHCLQFLVAVMATMFHIWHIKLHAN